MTHEEVKTAFMEECPVVYCGITYQRISALIYRKNHTGRGLRVRGLCCALAAFSPWGFGARDLRGCGARPAFWVLGALFLRFGLNSSIDNLRINVFSG